MKSVKETLLLISMPVAFLIGRRWKWSAKWCDAIGNVLWNDD